MDFEFTSEERNELLNRKELSFVLTFDGATPSRAHILGKLCALKNLEPSLAVLDSLKTHYGRQELEGKVRIYDDEASKLRVEPAHLMKRGVKAEGEGEA
ncbi:MAG: 30S ribosomal protein S24e [Methanomicrobiales archaeon]|nr:30S ribosomal protein S24e [Methanomicrobiales archaeon]